MNEILFRSLHRFWPEVVLTGGLLLVALMGAALIVRRRKDA